MGGELLGRRQPVQRHGEAVEAVPARPFGERRGGGGERWELSLTPELLVIDPVAPLNLAVLLRPARPDVPVPDPRLLDTQREGQGELGAVVILELADREWEGFPSRCETLETRHLILAAIEAEDPQAGAVVQSGVLEGLLPCDLHDLDIHLDGVTRVRLLEERELPRLGRARTTSG